MRHFSRAAVWFYLPWCVLAFLLIAATFSWRRQSVLLRQSVERAVGDPTLANLLTLEIQEANVSGEPASGRLARVVDAHNVIAMTYAFAFESALPKEQGVAIGISDPEWEPELVRLYAEDARPLVDELLEMVDEAPATWRLDSLEWGWYQGGMSTQLSSIAIMLSRVFADAFHRGDSPRAMGIVKLFDEIFPVDDPSSLDRLQLNMISGQKRMHDSIRRSLQKTFWTEAELEELLQVLETDKRWDDKWKRILTRNFVTAFHKESHPERRYRYRRGESPMWTRIAPSNRLDLVRSLEALLDVDLVDGDNAWRELWDPYGWDSGRPSINAFDTLLQRPDLVSGHVPASFLGARELAQQLALAVEDRRFTRCGVAIALFRTRYERWPSSLSELSQVGLSEKDTRYVLGTMFPYRMENKTPTLESGQYGLSGQVGYEQKITRIEFGL